MGKKDTCEKEFFADNRVFADLINGVVFGGKEVVHPEDLVEQDTTEVYSEYINNTLLNAQKYRDLLKHATIKKDKKCYYFLVGVENQTSVHYAMVLRAMLYDALNYSAQVVSIVKRHHADEGKESLDDYFAGMRKTDRVLPVITIIFYWGAGTWTAPRSLHELFPSGIPEEILRLVPDYSVPVLSPKEINDPSIFQTDLRAVIKAIAASGSRKSLRRLFATDPDFQKLERQTAITISTATDMGIKVPKDKEEINMCKAVEEWRNDLLKEGEAKGEARGAVKGEAKFAALVSAMTKNGDAANVQKTADDPAFREEMYKKYNL